MLSMAPATQLQRGSQLWLRLGPLCAVKTVYAQDAPKGVVQSATQCPVSLHHLQYKCARLMRMKDEQKHCIKASSRGDICHTSMDAA